MAWNRFPVAVVALLGVGSHALVPTKPLTATKLNPSVDYHASIDNATGLRLPRPQGLYYQDRPVASNTSVTRDGRERDFLNCELQYEPVTGQCRCGEDYFFVAVQEGDRGSDFGEWACPEALVGKNMAGRWLNYTMENVQHGPKVVQVIAGDDIMCDEATGCKPHFHQRAVKLTKWDAQGYILQTWPTLFCTRLYHPSYNIYRVRGFRWDLETLGGDSVQSVWDAVDHCGVSTNEWHHLQDDFHGRDYEEDYGRPSWRTFNVGFDMHIGSLNCVGWSLYEWSRKLTPEGLLIDHTSGPTYISPGWQDCFGAG